MYSGSGVNLCESSSPECLGYVHYLKIHPNTSVLCSFVFPLHHDRRVETAEATDRKNWAQAPRSTVLPSGGRLRSQSRGELRRKGGSEGMVTDPSRIPSDCSSSPRFVGLVSLRLRYQLRETKMGVRVYPPNLRIWARSPRVSSSKSMEPWGWSPKEIS